MHEEVPAYAGMTVCLIDGMHSDTHTLPRGFDQATLFKIQGDGEGVGRG